VSFENSVFLAGEKALSIIRDDGLRMNSVKVIPGAAGGPKWLVLEGLDRAIFGEWLRGREEPLFLVGSSIGAWRFAAVCQDDALAAIGRFEDSYVGQRYEYNPSVADISREINKIQDGYIGEEGAREILSHPFLRISFMAVRCRALTAPESRGPLSLGLGAAFAANAISRKTLRFFFERTLFYDPRDKPPFHDMDEFPINRVPLDEANLKAALRASGSVPLVIAGEPDVPGAPPGMYRDGGLIDYNLDMPFLPDNDGLVLYPHFSDRIIPGWFDKTLKRRRPSPENMSNVLLVAPSQEFIDSLPMKKIPDREDFRLFAGRDDERMEYWRTVIRQSVRLGEEFLEATESGKVRELVKPVN
jgi:hypothetical protein